MKSLLAMSLLTGVFFSAVPTEAQDSWRRSSRRSVVLHTTPIVTVQPRVTYGGFSHIDDLAIELEQRARALLWEMHHNYRYNPDFSVTYSEAYSMLRQAQALHAAEHRGDRAAILRIARELDDLFHHVEDDIRPWRPSHRHSIGHGSLADKMHAMEDTLHHLMQDVGVEATSSDPPAPSTTVPPPIPTFP